MVPNLCIRKEMTKHPHLSLKLHPSVRSLLEATEKTILVYPNRPGIVTVPTWWVRVPTFQMNVEGLGVTGGMFGIRCIFKGNTAQVALLPSPSHLAEVEVRNVWSDHTQIATFADLQLRLTRLLFWFTEKMNVIMPGTMPVTQ